MIDVKPPVTEQVQSHVQRPLTVKMRAIVDVMPADDAWIRQREIHHRLGYADGVGSTLYAMERRGLIQQSGPYWRWTRRALADVMATAEPIG